MWPWSQIWSFSKPNKDGNWTLKKSRICPIKMPYCLNCCAHWAFPVGIHSAKGTKRANGFKTHRLLKDREFCWLLKFHRKAHLKANSSKREGADWPPIKMSFIPTDKMGYVDSKVVYVDQALLEYPLELRKWQKGDVFHPFGMKGKRN